MTEVKKWEEISREEVFNKYGKKIDRVIFKLPNGKTDEFYVKNEGRTVCILALTKNGEVVLAKQFRPGPKDILLEMPGGGIEKNESPEQAGERELLEETGYKGDIKFVTEVLDCGYSTRKRFCMVVTDCEKISKQKLDESEFVEVVLVSLEEFRKLLRSGKMTDVEIGYLGLDYLNLL